MTKERKILVFLVVLLALFVGFLVIRTFSLNSLLISEQQYLADLKNKTVNQENLLTEPVISLTSPSLGQATAPITLVTFSSFDCPYCAQMFRDLTKLVEQYPDQVRIVWKDFVNLSDQRPLKAAMAARCAQSQNKFWEFASQLMASQADLGDSLFSSIAQQLNLDSSKFSICLANQETLTLVNNDFNEGLALQIDATPYSFIGSQRSSGALTFEQLQTIVENYQ